MRCNTWVFLLATLERLFAEDQLCNLPNIENGRIAQYYYSFKNYYFPMKKNEKLLYSCLPGYTTASGSKDARVNCTRQGWVPAPQCYKKCTKPPLDNGVFLDTGLTYKIWENLPYRCDSGFQSPGGNRDETIQCLQEGWSAQPQCVDTTTAPAETCLAPELLHGRYHTSRRIFHLNEKLKYGCDDAYYTAGGLSAGEAVCRADGWSLAPKCTKLVCSLRHPIEHGSVFPRKESYEEGDVVQFFCLEGYSLKGSELIQCYYFGWYPEPPICEERTNRCPPPPQPPHTKLLTNLRTYRHGDILSLECENPFQIQGAAVVHCEKGKWSSPPKCIDTGMTANIDGHRSLGNSGSCSSPPVVKNSFVLNNVNPLLTSFQVGSVVEYRCHSYHLMKGPNTVHCLHGNWTEPPVCLEPCLIGEELFVNHNIEMKWRLEEETYFLHGDIIEFSCKQGYVLSPIIQESQLLVQCNNGKLKYPSCVSKDLDEDCGAPPTVKNGAIVGLVTTDFRHGSTLEYSCHEYHFLQGSRKISCSRGQWTSPPICIEPCTLSTAEMANNNLNLRWVFDSRPYFLHGEYVEFICKPYHFRPPSSSPSDFRVQCQHGQILYPQCIGASRCCTFQKLPVYQQERVAYQEPGDPVIVSESSRNCGPPPAIANAMVHTFPREEFLVGSTVFYQCYRLYEMEGTPAARCFNGRWVGVPRCVQTCRADDPDMERNNIELKWITKSTSMTSSDYWMEFQCKPGFRKDPSSPPFRKQCLKGPWVYPRCI